MRAHTITTISRRRRSARRRRVLALALGVCALAIPATATAQANDSAKSANSITGGSSESSQPSGLVVRYSSHEDGDRERDPESPPASRRSSPARRAARATDSTG